MPKEVFDYEKSRLRCCRYRQHIRRLVDENIDAAESVAISPRVAELRAKRVKTQSWSEPENDQTSTTRSQSFKMTIRKIKYILL